AQRLVELVHQPGLAAPHRPPQIDAPHGCCRSRPVQRLMAPLQCPNGGLLSRIRPEAMRQRRLITGLGGVLRGRHDVWPGLRRRKSAATKKGRGNVIFAPSLSTTGQETGRLAIYAET